MLITVPNDFSGYNDKWKVFLAGPIQGAPKWQFALPELDNVVWLCPRRNDGVELNDQTHKDQMEWETQALRTSNIILFWIPEEVEYVESRSYAQTTRFELGENLARGKRIIIGVNDRLEIWSKERWEDFISNNEENMSDIADNLFSSI